LAYNGQSLNVPSFLQVADLVQEQNNIFLASDAQTLCHMFVERDYFHLGSPLL
jgi:hypothetical protein